MIQAIFLLKLVMIIVFLLLHMTGDPVSIMMDTDATQEDIDYMKKLMGFDQPLWVQYGRFFNNAIRDDFGESIEHGEPAMALVLERLPATLELSLLAALFALLTGIPMGIYTALRPGRWLSHFFLTLSLIGISLPTFLIGILLILLFGVILGWLPTFGRGEVVDLGWWTTGLLTESGIKSLLMPAFTLGIFQLTLIMRLVRSEMLEVLRTDYIKFARARVLTNRAVNFGHALKNTLVPVITITGLQLGSIIAFAIITETVFQWPGMGLLFIGAISSVDIPIMSAYLVLIALFFVLINLTVDILYNVVDPRLRGDMRSSLG